MAEEPIPEDEPLDLRDRADVERDEHDLGFEAGAAGKPNDDTKSAAWQRGWEDAHK